MQNFIIILSICLLVTNIESRYYSITKYNDCICDHNGFAPKSGWKDCEPFTKTLERDYEINDAYCAKLYYKIRKFVKSRQISQETNKNITNNNLNSKIHLTYFEWFSILLNQLLKIIFFMVNIITGTLFLYYYNKAV
jgi:hypothetical protein